MAIEDTIAALRKRIEEVEAAVAGLTSTLNINTVQKSDLDRLRAELVQLKDALGGAEETTLSMRVTAIEETLTSIADTLNTDTVQKSDLDRLRAELVQFKETFGEDIPEETWEARLASLETVLASTVASINAQTISKDDLDRLRAELVQLKESLEESAPAATQSSTTALEGRLTNLISTINAQTVSKTDLDRVRAELAQLKEVLGGAIDTSEESLRLRVDDLETALTNLTASVSTQIVSKSDLDRLRAELVQLKEALSGTEETSEVALRTKVETLEKSLTSLTSSINAQTISKDDLDRLRAELVQLKGALSRGDFSVAISTVDGLDALVNEQVALTSQTRALLDSVRDEVTAISADVNSNLELIEHLQNQVALLIIRITDVVGPRGPQGPVGSTGATGDAGISGEPGEQGISGEPGEQGPLGGTNMTLDDVCDNWYETDQDIHTSGMLRADVDVQGPFGSLNALSGSYHGLSGDYVQHGHTETLDNICDRGSGTDQVITAAEFRSSGDLYVNYGGPNSDSNIWFYKDGNQGAHLKWEHDYSRFECSHDFVAWGNLKATGNMYFNAGGPAGDGYLYFYENGIPTGAYLKWDEATTRFGFSHRIFTGGHVYIGGATDGAVVLNADSADINARCIFFKPTSGYEELYWDKTDGRFKFSHNLLVAGDLFMDGHDIHEVDHIYYTGSPVSGGMSWSSVTNAFEFETSVNVAGNLSCTGDFYISDIYLNESYDATDAIVNFRTSNSGGAGPLTIVDALWLDDDSSNPLTSILPGNIPALHDGDETTEAKYVFDSPWSIGVDLGAVREITRIRLYDDPADQNHPADTGPGWGGIYAGGGYDSLEIYTADTNGTWTLRETIHPVPRLPDHSGNPYTIDISLSEPYSCRFVKLYCNLGGLCAKNGGPIGMAEIRVDGYVGEGTESLRWDHTNSRFEFSNSLWISGDIRAVGDVYANADGPDGDSNLYFYKSSPGGAYLRWRNSYTRFDLSHDLSMQDHRITDVGDPISGQDVATKNYIEDNIPSLDDVCDIGNATDQDIHSSGSLVADEVLGARSIELNGNLVDSDIAIQFYFS